MKTKKILIAVLTAALFTAFVIGCNVPLDNTNLDIGKAQPAPDKKVEIRFNIVDSKSNARTIRPDTSSYQSVEDFDYFWLTVHNDDQSYDESLIATPFNGCFSYAAFSTGSLTVTDPGDTYTFTLLVSNDNLGDATTKYLAWGITTKLIPIGFDGTVDIELKEFAASGPSGYDGDGTFAWDVTGVVGLAANYTTVELKLYTLGGILKYTKDLLTFQTGNENFESGYYRMAIQLGKAGFQTVYVQEIVHIYSGFISTYAPLDLPTLRNTRYLITYNYGTDSVGGTLSGARAGSQYMNHGDNLLSTITNTDPAHSTDASGDDYDFDAWCTDSGANSPLDGTEKVLRPTTVYAKWIPTTTPVAGDFTITITSPQLEGDTFVPPTILPKMDKSTGARTIYYTNTVGVPTPTTTPPSAAGTYNVTFNVGKAKGFRAITNAATGGGLTAGSLTINPAKVPTEADYNIEIKSQRFGNVDSDPENVVIITPIDDSGAVTKIWFKSTGSTPSYGPSETVPTNVGRYVVTFDVDAATGWSPASGLYAGVLDITQFFAVKLVWSGGHEPTYDQNNTTKNYMEYNEGTGVLEIRIEIEGSYDYGTYVWKVDFDSSTDIGNNTKVLRISKNINNPLDDDRWFEVGDYGFTLFAGSESGRFTLTSDLSH